MADTRGSCSRNRRDAAGFSVRSGLEKHQHPQASLTQKKPARGRSKSTGTKNEAAFQDLKRWSRPPSSLAALHHLSQCKSLLPFKNLGEEYEALKKNKQQELKLDGSYENALLVDSTLLRQRDRINHSEIDIADVVCCFTLPDMHDKIISVVFSTELDSKDPYRHWLQKCNPMRCWTRLLHNVFLKHCKTTPGFEAAFDHIVLCTLLGNYEECDNRPTDIAVRQRMYDIFDYRRRTTYNDPEIASFRRKLLKDRECERIWLHATQQYMCWSISTNDELRRYVSNMYPFDKFRQIVTNVNNKMRRIWCEKLLSSTEPGDLIKALGAVIKEARLKILDVSYQKPVISFLQYLKELKSVAVPDARIWFERNFASSEYRLEELRKPVYIKPSSLLSKKKKDSDADDEEEQEVQAESDGEPDVDQEPVFEQMATMQTRPLEEDKRRPVLITAAQITVAHSEALELLVASLDPTKTSDDDILRQLNAHWTKFGCDPQAGPHLDVLSSEYRISNLPKDVWRKKMIRFARMHPYAYCLLHEARKLVLRMRGRRVTPLPSNIAAKQVQVLADKLKLPPDTVNRESAALWACPCCGEVASLVRSHYSYHKQEYTDGRRGILTSLEGKGQVFCKKDNVVGHRQCGKEPLMEIPLLGYCVTFNKVTHEICCSCGSVMSADPEHTLFNADGAACSQCTRKIMQQQRDAHLALYPELLRPRDFKCMLCDKQLEKGALSHSRYLCKGQKFVCAKKHGGEALVKHLLATLPKDVQEQAFVSDEAAKAVAEAAIKFHKAAKQLKAERDKGKNNRILKQLRANAAAALSRR